jgi:hypothetical protein
VIWLDAFHLKDGDYVLERDRVQGAVRAIQSHPKFLNVPIVLVAEGAPGNCATTLAQHLVGYPNVLTMRECGTSSGRLGVKYDEETRTLQTTDATILLANGAVFYSENLMTWPEPGMPLERRIDLLKEKLEKQLVCWENIVDEDPADPFKKVRRKWTAKLGAGNDDLAVCFVMFWWHKAFVHSSKPEYSTFFQEHVLLRTAEAASGAYPSAREAYNPRAHLPAQPRQVSAVRPPPPGRRM